MAANMYLSVQPSKWVKRPLHTVIHTYFIDMPNGSDILKSRRDRPVAGLHGDLRHRKASRWRTHLLDKPTSMK